MPFLPRLHAAARRLFSGKWRPWSFVGLGLVAFAGLAVPKVTHAAGQCGVGSLDVCAAMIFVWIFQALTALMGHILILEVDALIKVAQYFNFVNPGPTAVRIGWIVTRDLANMFFIVFLLIIAFSTAIGYEKYHYQKNLNTLLTMAVVINFSKTLCGILIDASQVIMLSFVNGFKAAAAGNFLNGFQINELLQLADGVQTYDFGLVLAMMLAFIMAATAACIVLIMVVIMAYRIIGLWILIILSPIAFLTKAFPFESSYYGEWWSRLKKYLIGGPVIAFFLWLALVTAQQTNGNLASAGEGWAPSSAASQAELGAETAKIPSEAGRTDTLLSLIIITCILFAGLQFASDPKYAAEGAGFGKEVSGRLKKALKGAAYGSFGTAKSAVIEPATRLAGKLSNMPVVGDLARIAALKGEKMKKERLGRLEKTYGSLDDMARLSPDIFRARMNSLAKKGKLDKIDKDRLNTMLGIALKKPEMARELGEGQEGAFALNSLILDSEGKGLQDAVGIAMSDKNAGAWVKNPADEYAFLKSVHGKLRSEAYELDAAGEILKDDKGKDVVKDPNLVKTLGEFEQKFAPQLIAGNLMGVDKLKNIVPKMSSDDIGGIAKGDMGTFMPYMTSGQFKKILSDGKPDQLSGVQEAIGKMSKDDAHAFLREHGIGGADVPSSWYAGGDGADPKKNALADFVLAATKGKAEARSEVMADPERAAAMHGAANRSLEEAQASNDKDKIAAAAVQAITVGSLTADKIKGNDGLRNALATHVDPSSLARNISKDDAGQLDAAREIMTAMAAADPERVRNLSKNDLYAKIVPSKADLDALVSSRRSGENAQLRNEAPVLAKNLESDIKRLTDEIQADRAANRPVSFKESQVSRMAESFQNLQQALSKHDNASKELAQMEQRHTERKAAGADAAELSSLKSAVERLQKGIQDLDTDLVRQVSTLKGLKAQEGKGRVRNQRSGGGRGNNI